MKPLPLFVVAFLIAFAIIILIPQLARVHLVREAFGSPFVPTVIAPSASISVAETGLYPGMAVLDAPSDVAGYVGLFEFSAQLVNGRADEVVGAYAPGLFALRVDQQPSGHPEYVNRENNLITEFSLPKKYGSTGLLAHNYLSGSQFFQLKKSQDVILVYGDGRLEHYRIDQVQTYKALKPNSPFSDFVDLADPDGEVLTSADLFNRVYTFEDTLVFQTCIESEGDPSWGRMFVVAKQIEGLQMGLPDQTLATSDN